MSWLGFAVFCTASVALFALGAWACFRGGKRASAWSAGLLVLLVASVGLRYQPVLEARIFPADPYAYVRPWASIVLALGFLGSAVPQLAEKRKRVAVAALSFVLFSIVAERAVATVELGSDHFTGVPDERFGTCKQTTGFSCGAAAASTLLAQFGVASTEAEMAERCVTNLLTGTDEIGVVKGLAEKVGGRGFDVELVGVPTADLVHTELPAMASTKHSLMIGHWVVVLRCEGETLSVADPMFADNARGGVREVPLEEFEKQYQGVLVRVRRGQELLPLP